MIRAICLLAAVFGAAPAWAEAAPHIIEGEFAAKVPTEPETGAWTKATPLTVTLYRQRTVRLRDKDVNHKLDTELGPRTAAVKVVYSKKQLGVQVSWDDATQDQLEHAYHDAFGDAVAIEFPQKYGMGESLPYVGMGDIDHPVVVTIQRAHKDASHNRQFVAAGFGSLTAIERDTEMKMTYDAAAKRWHAVFVRPLKDHNLDLTHGLVPMGLAIWEGGVHERGGNKALAPWRFIRLGKHKLDPDYLAYVSWGEDGQPIGDPKKGETIAKTQCIACHRFADQQVAPVGIAPGLENIGGYAVARYLQESVQEPSKVILRPLNPNRHYDKSGKRDPHGAYPNAVAYTWSVPGADGKHMSKMPPFAHLPADDVNNLVAYLKTIKDPLNTKGAQ
ncbi:MAG: c-type cytochrome [Myxococcales bacterium]|nr:c-type cytochrome [Myxococcales bacterium]